MANLIDNSIDNKLFITTYGRNPKVLIVEDESLISWSLAYSLGKAGIEIIVAESGEKAIERLGSCVIDLVITDRKLPHIDGFQVASAVKAFDPHVPVIMISAQGDVSGNDKTHERVVDCFVEKPYDLAEMTKLVRRQILAKNLTTS